MKNPNRNLSPLANNFKGTITEDYNADEELDEETERTLLLAPVCFEDMVLIHSCAKALGLTDPI